MNVNQSRLLALLCIAIMYICVHSMYFSLFKPQAVNGEWIVHVGGCFT